MTELLKHLEVDFGEVAGDDLLSAFAVPGIMSGDMALLFDDEGNRCYGKVDRVEGRLAWVSPILATWAPATLPEPAVSDGSAQSGYVIIEGTVFAPSAYTWHGSTSGPTFDDRVSQTTAHEPV